MAIIYMIYRCKRVRICLEGNPKETMNIKEKLQNFLDKKSGNDYKKKVKVR